MSRINRKFRTAVITLIVLISIWGIFITSVLITSDCETIISRSVPSSGPVLVLPSGFSATPRSFDGGEIEYHLDITGAKNTIRGYFQIIFMGTDLETYLKNAEKYKAADINMFSQYKGDYPGSVIWEYTTPKSNVLYFFAKKGQRLYVLTLSADKSIVSMDELKEYFTQVRNGLVL